MKGHAPTGTTTAQLQAAWTREERAAVELVVVCTSSASESRGRGSLRSRRCAFGMGCQQLAWFAREEGYRRGVWGMLTVGELWSQGERR
jgi:hypothetical protein